MIDNQIRWKPIFIGVIIVLALYIISNLLSGSNTTLSDFLLVSTVVGFMVGGKIKNGLINGAIFGVIAGVIVTLIMVALYLLQGYGAYLSYMTYSLVLYLVIEIIIGVIGGILGSLIKVEAYKYGLKNE